MAEKKDRTNETRVNNNGEEMRIIRYGNAHDIDVQFIKDGTIVEHRHYCAFKKGNIKNPMSPIVYGVGYFGIGDFKCHDENGKITKCYNTWESIYRRCYDPKFHERESTYENCTVDEQWWNYQRFGKWFGENYYEVGNERMVLDKDILHKGNKVYSPDTCIFVPNSINMLFTKSNKSRGKLPIGVYKVGNKFQAKLSKGNGKSIHLGLYTTHEEAFLAYKKAKEQYIKEVAEKYKSQIPQKLYEALMNYEVEIDD